MKSILVPVAGSNSDAGVFSAAHVLSRRLGAHLACLHVHVDPASAAFHTPYVGSARGTAVAHAFRELRERSGRRLVTAAEHFKQFCAENRIASQRSDEAAVSASWQEANGDALAHVLHEARYHDLTIMCRPSEVDGLPHDRLETVLMGSGRPLLVMPPDATMQGLDTAVVCWKETPEATRAVAAALPLLKAAAKVVVISLRERAGREPSGLLAYLARYGITAQSEEVARHRESMFAALEAKALALGADVMVMGGYGRSRLQEFVFGGVTQAALEHGKLPLFIMH